MRINNLTKHLFAGTLLSVLIFFSISFITVLFHINSPLHRINDFHELKIGFPFIYYHEFMVEFPIPNSGWYLTNLILDCFLTWLIVTAIYLKTKKLQNPNRH